MQKRVISKAKNLGIDLLKISKINKIRSFQNRHFYIAREIAGSPPLNPWQREEYERPQIAQPIKNPIKNIAQAFFQKIETLALKAKSFGAKIKSFFGKKKKKLEKFAGGSKVEEEKRSFLKATIEEKVFKESEKEMKSIAQKVEEEKQAGLEEKLREEKESEKIKVIKATVENEIRIKEEIKSEKEMRIKEGKEKKEIRWCSIKENLNQPKHEIIFNEIAWMGTKISSQNEWIELKNLTSKEINLSGYQLQSKDGKIKIVFPEIKLPPFGLLLLERSDDSTLPQIKADLIYKGIIKNSNEALFLFDKNCQLEDKVEANPFWPAGDNDSKRTMERKTDFSWQTSFLPGGTPKKENSSGYFEEPPQMVQEEKTISKTYPKILISEVYLGSENNPKDEFVELYNPNDQEIDLSGWYLQRKTKNAKKFSSYASSKLFSNKKIPAKSYLLIAREGSSFEKIADVIVKKPLTFNNTLVLKNPARKIVDEVFWKEVPPAKSYGRKWENGTYKDTNNCFYDFEIQKPTPKAKNSKPKESSFSGRGGGSQIILAVGGGKKGESKEKTSQISFCQIPSSLNPTYQVIFSEIAWAGALDNASDEWIELSNFSQKEINLKNWQILGVNLKNNQTKIKFVFEKDLKIKPKDFVLLERSDDETVPEIQADGIFTGSINNSDFALYLFDPQCQLSDFVLASSSWPAGDNKEKRSMERDENLNWHSYFGPPQTFGSKIIFGTPKTENSTSTTSTISTTFSTSSTSTLPSLLISELYFGTSSKIRFLEIYNPNDFEISLDDFSVQYLGGKSQIKEFPTSSIDLEKFSSKIKKFNLSGSIKPFGYYLIASTSSVFGIKADKVFKTFNPALTGGTIFLVASQNRLASPTSTQILDQLAWGTPSKLGALFPEKTPAPLPLKNSSLERKAFKDSTLENFPCWQNFGRSFDSQDNSFDFILQNSPSPQNSQSFSQNPEEYFLPLPLPEKIKSSFSSSSLTLNLSWQIPENFPFKNFFTKIYLVTSTQENLSSSTLLELSKASFSTTTATSTSIKIKSLSQYFYFGLSFESPLCQKTSEIVWKKVFIPSFIKNAYFYQAKYRDSQTPKYFLEIEFETKDWISTSDEYPSLILVNLNQPPSEKEFLSAIPHGPHPWIPEKINSFLAFLLKRSSSSLTVKAIRYPQNDHWDFDDYHSLPQTDENDLTLRIPLEFNGSFSTSSYLTFSFYQRRLNTYYLLGFDLKRYYFGQKPQFYLPQKPKISFSLDENLPSVVKVSITPSIDQDSLDKKLFYQVHLIEKEASSTFIFDVFDDVKKALSMTPLPYHLQENDELKVLVEVFDEFGNSNSASSTFIYPFKVKKEFGNGKPSSNWKKFGYKVSHFWGDDDHSLIFQNFSLKEKISFNLLALRFKPKKAC
ncbi:lamin tail domain-containing protein, partial [bacterium]|nr:lamin tail domain-containing protein [bacterium]